MGGEALLLGEMEFWRRLPLNKKWKAIMADVVSQPPFFPLVRAGNTFECCFRRSMAPYAVKRPESRAVRHRRQQRQAWEIEAQVATTENIKVFEGPRIES